MFSLRGVHLAIPAIIHWVLAGIFALAAALSAQVLVRPAIAETACQLGNAKDSHEADSPKPGKFKPKDVHKKVNWVANAIGIIAAFGLSNIAYTAILRLIGLDSYAVALAAAIIIMLCTIMAYSMLFSQNSRHAMKRLVTQGRLRQRRDHQRIKTPKKHMGQRFFQACCYFAGITFICTEAFQSFYYFVFDPKALLANWGVAGYVCASLVALCTTLVMVEMVRYAITHLMRMTGVRG